MSERLSVHVQNMNSCGEDVLEVVLTKPPDWDYRPGQWLRLSVLTSEGEQTKTFSISSAPHDDFLSIATRLSDSPFKRALGSLAAGDVVRIQGPGGRLALPATERRVCFLVGGVGITPVRSILRDASENGRVFDDAVVLYGIRDPGCALYIEELQAMGDAGIRVVEVAESAPTGWSGERGFITAELVRRHLEAVSSYILLVVGPPAMTVSMQGVLDELGIEPARRLVESFGSAAISGRAES